MFRDRSIRRRAVTPGRPAPDPAGRVSPPRTPAPVVYAGAARSVPLEDMVERLDLAVAGVDAYLDDRWVSAAGLVNPMLVVWDAARGVHPQVAAPVEKLLTGLLHRAVIGPNEVRASIAEVRARALEVLIVEHGVLTG